MNLGTWVHPAGDLRDALPCLRAWGALGIPFCLEGLEMASCELRDTLPFLQSGKPRYILPVSPVSHCIACKLREPQGCHA